MQDWIGLPTTNWDFEPLSNGDFEKKVPPTNVDVDKTVTPTNGDFDQKFRKFETKSDFFPIAKIGNRNTSKYDNLISLEVHLRKF